MPPRKPQPRQESPVDHDSGEDEVYDDDELDELSEEEDDPFVFKIKGAVAPANARNVSMQELNELIHNGVIDLNPPYQREAVWPQAKQSKLIDSIFRNYFIPPLVFAVRRDQDLGEDVMICVDGKQRLTSIVKFMDGSIPHKNPVTKRLWWYTSPNTSGSKSRLQIPDEFKEEFGRRTLTCVEYRGLSQDSERQIFQRVQMGVALQPGEKLQAISSPRAEWIGRMSKKHINLGTKDGLDTVLKFDTKRARDFQNIASLAYCCDGLPNEQRIPTAVVIDTWLTSEDTPRKTFKEAVDTVLDDLYYLATEPKFNKDILQLQKSKRIAPVEFIFIGVLLYRLQRKSWSSKAKAIYTLCKTIRQEYRDVRTNTVVCKSLWGHVDTLTEDPTDDIVLKSKPKPSTKKPAKSNKKRKLGSDEEEDEDDGPSTSTKKKAPVRKR
ncbi:hypothetical protein FA15DRAFT_664354 [Coprinopsis marcescibilis]|uniref:GmrSD restriction endonucleases N-terminal domain-containing protein n=1 Tax=Coprinopsis marcescibilis TaxID=230819 RepID=A0A5C3L9N3_COPMA|nr:hypothetical protein FA15DRAFT_664354 [Coprinopsis marcescibilis]